MIPSSATTIAANKRANNENANNNPANDSNKLLTPKSASTTTTSNNTNSSTNNSEENTRSKLISSRIDEERNGSQECDNAYAAKQDVKEKIQVKNLDQWKKRITLVVGDSTLAGLREAKLSRSKRIKICYFPAGKT